MKQTAVEWLEQINNHCKKYGRTIEQKDIEQAKEMEKEQIKDAWIDGDNSDCLSEQDSSDFAEQYYNETFNTNEK
jgi:hypothetical protein